MRKGHEFADLGSGRSVLAHGLHAVGVLLVLGHAIKPQRASSQQVRAQSE